MALLLTGAPLAARAAEPSATPPFPAARDDATVFTWLKANTSLRAGQAVAFTPDSVLVILSDAVAGGAVHRITYREEATAIGFVARTGGRSVRGEAELDCAAGTARSTKRELYSGSDFRGHLISEAAPETDWQAPRAGSSLALALAQGCPRRPTATPVPARVPTAPTIRIASLGPSPLASAPASAPAARPTEPAPAAPPRPRLVRASVQIGAFTTPALAQAALDRDAPGEEPDGRFTRVEPVTSGGALLYRALVHGFASAADARAFCAGLAAKGRACFVR